MRQKGEYLIREPRVLRRLLQDVMVHQGLSQAALARRLGFRPPYVSKLLGGKHERIGRDKLAALSRLRGMDRTVLQYAVASPEAVVDVFRYRAWLSRELARYGHYFGSGESSASFVLGVEEGWGVQSAPNPRDQVHTDIAWLYDRLAATRWWSHFEASQDWLDARWGGSREAESRGLLAQLEVLAPLTATGRTQGVERSLEELMRDRSSAGSLDAYLAAAFRAQRALLARAMALECAQRGRPVLPPKRARSAKRRAGKARR